MPPENDDCGNECPNGEAKSNGFCEDCPVKEANDEFKELATAELEEKLKGEWQKYGFDNLLETVYDILEISRNLERKYWTVKTDRLVSILEGVKSRIERIDEFNRRPNSNNE